MGTNNKITLYVSYYLARFNNDALRNLGYLTWNEAFTDIGLKLGVKVRSVKNWRDEFDPIFDHRLGWHKRPMHPSRIRIAQALEDLDELQIREIVLDILSGKIFQNADEIEQLLAVVPDETSKVIREFIVRGPTGKLAEELFMQAHSDRTIPYSGNLVDCRDLGCGYDFKVVSKDGEKFIEVKGLAEIAGGILFTEKEWRTAKEFGTRYIVCIVKNVNKNPTLYFIADPTNRFAAKKNIYTTIQVNWSVSDKELRSSIAADKE